MTQPPHVLYSIKTHADATRQPPQPSRATSPSPGGGRAGQPRRRAVEEAVLPRSARRRPLQGCASGGRGGRRLRGRRPPAGRGESGRVHTCISAGWREEEETTDDSEATPKTDDSEATPKRRGAGRKLAWPCILASHVADRPRRVAPCFPAGSTSSDGRPGRAKSANGTAASLPLPQSPPRCDPAPSSARHSLSPAASHTESESLPQGDALEVKLAPVAESATVAACAGPPAAAVWPLSCPSPLCAGIGARAGSLHLSWRISRGDGGIVSGAGAGRPELERPLGADAGIASAAMATAASASSSLGVDLAAAAGALTLLSESLSFTAVIAAAAAAAIRSSRSLGLPVEQGTGVMSRWC